jgi:hypothetical protein
MENDTNPPDFIQQLVDDGKVRQVCRKNPQDMDEEEQKFLLDKKLEYYKLEPLKILKSLIPFKHPQFSLIDQIDLSQLEEIISGDSVQTKLWLWIDFVKPGRHTFCVKTPHTNIEGTRTKGNVYVHKMWSQMRTEDFPKRLIGD